MALAKHLHGAPDSRTEGTTIATDRGYDAFVAAFFMGRRHSTFAELVRLSGAKSGDHVLDVGCGTGYLTRMLARAVGPDGQAHGVDPSPGPLARARALARKLPNCEFHDGTAEHLAAPDDHLDVVVSSLTIHHLPIDQQRPALDEMFRVLRPGGRLLVADFRPPTSALGRRVVGGIVGAGMAANPFDLFGGLVRGAGLEEVDSGDVKPWIHWVSGVKPQH